MINSLRIRHARSCCRSIEILTHLLELDARRAYRDAGYNSLFAYCTSALGYSEGAAYRRVKSARCIGKHRAVGAYLSQGKVTLSTIAAVSEFSDKDDFDVLLNQVLHKPTREVKTLVAAYAGRPTAEVRDKITPVVVESATSAIPLPTKPLHFRQESISTPTQPLPAPTAKPAGAMESRLKVQFSAKPQFEEKFRKVQSLLSTKYPRGMSFETVFEELMDQFIAKQSPKPRKAKPSSRRTRHIPAQIRREVMKRDEGRCTFMSKEGKRCNSEWNVHIDHIKPYALGGEHTIENLRCLCADHNQAAAEKVFGKRE